VGCSGKEGRGSGFAGVRCPHDRMEYGRLRRLVCGHPGCPTRRCRLAAHNRATGNVAKACVQGRGAVCELETKECRIHQGAIEELGVCAGSVRASARAVECDSKGCAGSRGHEAQEWLQCSGIFASATVAMCVARTKRRAPGPINSIIAGWFRSCTDKSTGIKFVTCRQGRKGGRMAHYSFNNFFCVRCRGKTVKEA
jgi:hypothetical protein